MHSIARTITLNREIPGLGRRYGVIKAGELDLVHRAGGIIEKARQEADEIVRAAREQAASLLKQQQREAERQREEIVRTAESTIWKQAIAYHEALEQQFRRFTTALEDQAMPVVRKAITILAHETPPEQRIVVCVRSLLAEVGRPADSTLYVNEQDRAALEALPTAPAWAIAVDNDIPAGSCRLESRRGEWRSTFDGRLARLLEVFDEAHSMAAQEEKELSVPADR